MLRSFAPYKSACKVRIKYHQSARALHPVNIRKEYKSRSERHIVIKKTATSPSKLLNVFGFLLIHFHSAVQHPSLPTAKLQTTIIVFYIMVKYNSAQDVLFGWLVENCHKEKTRIVWSLLWCTMYCSLSCSEQFLHKTMGMWYLFQIKWWFLS